MQTSLRMIAMGLLGAIFIALPGAQALSAFSIAPARHPAGCHSHAPATPSPTPPSYQCCVSGHAAAIPNAAFSNPLEARICGMAVAQQLRLDSSSDRLSVLFVVPSNSPPGAVSLRI
jgi:hypothetical protein